MDDELRFKIPQVLLEGFTKEPYILLKKYPPGIWPIDIRMLADSDMWKRLVDNKEFNEKFEIVIMPRG